MKILKLEQSKQPRAVEIRAILGDTEFEQLRGALDGLCAFSTTDVKEPSSIIKSGKRSQFAKYALIPISIRHDHKTDDYDFTQLKAGAVKYRDRLYIIFGVPKRMDSTHHVEE